MQATSLSVNMPGPCNADCPFCISKLTGHCEEKAIDPSALMKAFKYAAHHKVDTVLFTGKGEPTLNFPFLELAIREASEIFPIIELQTNGLVLWEDYTSGNFKLLDRLRHLGLTTLSISICDFIASFNTGILQPSAKKYQSYNYLDLVTYVNELGLLCRISLNMNNVNYELIPERIRDGAIDIKEAGGHQLTLRELGIPNSYPESHEHIVDWIKEYSLSNYQLMAIKKEVEDENRMLRTVSYGPNVYDYHGLSTVIASCMSDNKDPEEIRSLILQPNGHLYHSWNFEGSILL